MDNASAHDISILRDGGAILAQILHTVASAVQPGISTGALNDIAEAQMKQADVTPSFLGYHGYPAVLCTSVNDHVVHGIPTDQQILKDGDIVGLDIGIKYKGLITDMAVTVAVGSIAAATQRLLEVTKHSLDVAIASLKPGMTTGDLGAIIQKVNEDAGFGIVKDLVGHGVGNAVHEDPMVPNFGKPGKGDVLEQGMVIAIEPMVTAGDWRVHTLEDGWTVVTNDHSLSAHYEHTVVITAIGATILTQTHGNNPWP